MKSGKLLTQNLSKPLKLVGILISVVIYSTDCMALIHAEFGAGNKTTDLVYDTQTETDKKQEISGSEIYGHLMFDPIPMVPVGFGLSFQTYSIDASKGFEKSMNDVLGDDYELKGDYTIAGVGYGPFIKIWAPTPYVKPFLRYTYVMGTEVSKFDYEVESAANNVSLTSKGTKTSSFTGSDIGLGLTYSPIKFFNLSLEYVMHSGSVKTSSIDEANVTTVNSESTATSRTYDDLSADEKKADTRTAKSIRFAIGVGL